MYLSGNVLDSLHFVRLDPDPDPGGPKCYKSEENFSFEVLDVLFTQGTKVLNIASCTICGNNLNYENMVMREA
jgi:hypothetical protein